MNAKKTNTKKILNIVVNVILWLFVAFAVVVTVVAVTASANKKNVPVVGGKCFLSVQSQSMNAAKPEGVASDKPAGFAQGDMIVGRYICDDDKAIDALEAGDVITFEFDINGDGQISPGEYNTHRIIAVNTGSDGKVVSFVTKGDNNEMQDANAVTRSKIIAVYTGSKIGGLGAAQTFLGSQLGFGLCILLPLVAFFVYQLVVFIRTVLQVKNADKKVITAADEELIRQRAIEEYLRQQAAQNGTDVANGSADETASNPDETNPEAK